MSTYRNKDRLKFLLKPTPPAGFFNYREDEMITK